MVPTGRDTYEYREGSRRMEIVAELLSGEPQRVIYASSIHAWLPPHEAEPISDEARRTILARVCRYFQANGQSYVVE